MLNHNIDFSWQHPYLRGGDLFTGLSDLLLGDEDLLYLRRGDGDLLLGDLRLGDGLLLYLLGDLLLGDLDLRRGEYRLLGDLDRLGDLN